MAKLCVNTRDELHFIETEDLLYLKASGNYTDFHFVDGQERSQVQCLSFFEQAIAERYAHLPNPFYRLGRSYLINTAHLETIHLQKEELTFHTTPTIRLAVSKGLLKKLKEHLLQSSASLV